MKILLAYSLHHFNPYRKGNESPNPGASAAILAKSLYEELSKLGEVDYVDALRPPKKLPHDHYDLLVSLLGAITPLTQLAQINSVILFAVNMHPMERNRILQHAYDTDHRCSSRHLNRALIRLNVLDDFQRADAVLTVGNSTVLNSFLRCGLPLQRVRAINYAGAVPAVTASSGAGKTSSRRFIYLATEMCLRKGFDLLSGMFSSAGFQEKDFRLTIVGGLGSKEYKAKLEALKGILGDKLDVRGWVDSTSEEYREILSGQDFIVFPSLEEGQAGSVLDVLPLGIIPIVTPATGIDFSPLGFLDSECHSAHNQAVLEKAMCLGEQELAMLKERTVTYFRTQHEQWRDCLRNILHSYQQHGSLWPELVVSLPDTVGAETAFAAIRKVYPHSRLAAADSESGAANGRYSVEIRDVSLCNAPELLYDSILFMENNAACHRLSLSDANERILAVLTKEGAHPSPAGEYVLRVAATSPAGGWLPVCFACTAAAGVEQPCIPVLRAQPPGKCHPHQLLSRRIPKIFAFLLQGFCPSKQWRKRLYNYYRMP